MSSLKVIYNTILKKHADVITNYMLKTSVKAYKEGSERISKDLGIATEWNKADDESLKFIKNYRTPYFKDLSDTTKKYLFGAIRDTIKKGETWDALYNKLKGNKAFTKARSKLIFRTEIARAADAGARARMKALDVKEGYIDVHPQGCPICMPYHKQVMKLKDLPTLPIHPNCLIDGQTPIFTIDGWKPIRDVKLNDLVLTHKGRFKKVTHVFRIPEQIENVVKIFFNNHGMNITLTEDHPVYSNGKWIPVRDIKIGDEVSILTSLYKFVNLPVIKIDRWTTEKPVTLFNLEVEDDHSYIANGVTIKNCRCVTVPIPPKPEKLKRKVKKMKEKLAPEFGKYQTMFNKGEKLADEILDEIGDPDHLFDVDHMYKFNDLLMEKLGKNKAFMDIVGFLDDYQTSTYTSGSKALEEMTSILKHGKKIPDMRNGKLMALEYKEKNIKETARAIGISRRYYDRTINKPVYIARGVQDEYAKDIFDSIKNEKKAKVTSYVLTSYSQLGDKAEEFAKLGDFFGLAYEVEIETNDISFIPSLFTSGLMDEEELILGRRFFDITEKSIIWAGEIK